MTPRQRIEMTLQHRQPDRVAVDLGGTESSGIMAIAYNRLKNHLHLGGRTQVYDLGQMIAKVEPEVLTAVGADAMALLIEPRQWKPFTLQDGSGAEIPAGADVQRLATGDWVLRDRAGTVVARCPATGLYFDTVCHPLASAQTPQDIDAGAAHMQGFDWPDYMDEDFDDLARKARLLYEQTDFALVANLWVHLFAAGQFLRGYEEFMMDLAGDKPMAHRFFERQVEAYLPRVEQYLRAVGPYVQAIQVNDDLGGQQGPLLSPPLYREMIKPYHRQLWSAIKQASGKPLLLHSCGSIRALIPDLIELGVDAINPVQVSAAGMDTAELKRQFGKDLTFWGGGCDTQSVLARGTPVQVRDEVRRRVDDLAPGGGFVFCQVHNIQADVPVENILAMYEELGTLA